MLFREWFCEVRDWFQVFVFKYLNWHQNGQRTMFTLMITEHQDGFWSCCPTPHSGIEWTWGVTGHEELEWTCIKGSSDWAAGKGPSPRGWWGTGTGSWGKWSQHQASRTLWTMLSASFSFRWSWEEQGAGLGDAYGSLPTWYSVIPESLGLCGKWSEGGERCFLLRCALQQRHGISPAERGHLEMHCPK